MPITKRNGKYYWGSKGPFDSRKKAAEVAQAAHASGYEGSVEIEKILPALAALGGAAAGAAGAAASAAGPIAGAIGRTAMRSLAGGKLKDTFGGGGGGGEDESGGLDEQDSHAQSEWENIHNSKSMQKLMNFVQIQKIGYTTEPQPPPRRRDFPDTQDYWEAIGTHYRNPRQSTELNPQWEAGDFNPQTEFPSEAVKKIGRDIGNQSYGIPAIGSKEHQKILSTIAAAEPWNKEHLEPVIANMKSGMNYQDAWDNPGNPINDSLYTTDDDTIYPGKGAPWREITTRADPVALAHSYVRHIQAGDTGAEGQRRGPGMRRSFPEDYSPTDENSMSEVGSHRSILAHLEGHSAIAEIHNIMNYGKDYKDHPDAIKYRTPRENPHYDEIKRFMAEGRGEKYDIPKYIPEEGRAGISGMDSRLNDIDKESMSFLDYQKRFANDHLDSSRMSNAAHGTSDQLYRKLRMESPLYDSTAEEAYHLTHYPENEWTGAWNASAPRGAEEGIGQPMSARGREPVAPEGKTNFEAIVDRNKEVGPRYPRGVIGRQGTTENMPKYFNTLEERQQFHDTREPLPGEDEINYGRRTRHEKDKNLYDKFNRGKGTVPPPIPGDPPPNPLPDAWRAQYPGLFGDKEKAVAKLEKFMRKEGAVGGEGGGFDGLSDTVFTSTNAGIFTPTYGGKGTKKKHRKNNKRQDKKRRKLMGKEKKSGVERLVQYLYDGSPHMSKAGKMGLAPGLDDDMTGDGATAHAWNNKATQPAILNHKKTSREIEDAMEVAKENEPHISMGQPGGFETGITATVPVRHSSVNSVGNAGNPRAQDWGQYKSYVQKAVNGVSTMISPDGNTKSADGSHPQKAFIERGTENPNEAPAKDAVLKENDMQRRVKKYDDKASRRDGGQEQPAGSMAAAGSAGYPSGATMQMSSFGMNTYEQDSLARGGEEDTGHDEEEIDEKKDEENPRLDEEGNVWIPMNPDRTKSLESMRKALEDAGDEAPLLTALYKLDYS